MKKAKASKREKKRSPVKDLTPRRAGAVKGGYKPQKPDGSL